MRLCSWSRFQVVREKLSWVVDRNLKKWFVFPSSFNLVCSWCLRNLSLFLPQGWWFVCAKQKIVFLLLSSQKGNMNLSMVRLAILDVNASFICALLCSFFILSNKFCSVPSTCTIYCMYIPRRLSEATTTRGKEKLRPNCVQNGLPPWIFK